MRFVWTDGSSLLLNHGSVKKSRNIFSEVKNKVRYVVIKKKRIICPGISRVLYHITSTVFKYIHIYTVRSYYYKYV